MRYLLFFKKNYYYGNREWPYKNVKPRILIEKYMEDNEDKELRDYKFYFVIAIDSTGIKVSNLGEWIRHKWNSQ